MEIHNVQSEISPKLQVQKYKSGVVIKKLVECCLRSEGLYYKIVNQDICRLAETVYNFVRKNCEKQE